MPFFSSPASFLVLAVISYHRSLTRIAVPSFVTALMKTLKKLPFREAASRREFSRGIFLLIERVVHVETKSAFHLVCHFLFFHLSVSFLELLWVNFLLRVAVDTDKDSRFPLHGLVPLGGGDDTGLAGSACPEILRQVDPDRQDVPLDLHLDVFIFILLSVF